ncbi:MAG: hypothetical protein CSA84_01485 [Actinomycetales bacterium]|nr:MAG: hypothetical protein CSA84_01485 [Actinomycetales bacterium]
MAGLFHRLRALVIPEFLVNLTRQRPILSLLVVCVVAFLVCDGVVGAGLSRYAESVQYRSALNLIEVSAVAPSARRELDASSLEEMRQIDGVTGVYPWGQVDLAMSDPADWPDANENPGNLGATPAVPGLLPPTVAGKVPDDGLGPDEIALPHEVPGGFLDDLLGQTVVFESTRPVEPGVGEPVRYEMRVVAIVDNSTPGDAGPTPSFVSPASFAELLELTRPPGGASRQLVTAYVRARSADDVPRIQAELSERGFAVASMASRLTSLTGLFSVLRWVGYLFGFIVLGMCLMAGGAMGSTWAQHRRRDIGLLKAVGWTRKEIHGALLAELGGFGLVAGLAGVVLGNAASYVATAIVAGLNIEMLPVVAWQPPGVSNSVLALILVPLAVCVGGLRHTFKASALNPDETLRDL